MSIHPYLFFTSTTREAMTTYHEILGGRLDIMSATDLPDGEDLPFEAPDDLVVHAALVFDDGFMLMASDDPTGDGDGVKGMAVNLTLDDRDEARRVFEALATGGTVGMPLGETFWSPLFGTCVDRFGVTWMVNVDEGS
jgi:PhnB protein